MAVAIEEMCAEDYDDVVALWKVTKGVGISKADERETVERYLVRNRGISSVARVDGRIVGAVMCGHDGRRGYLYHLAVADSHRRRGIGQALVERSLARLRDEGILRCYIMVYTANAEGRAFWTRTGWREPDTFGLMLRDL
jgi:N-acetylglutamate synthase